MSDFPRSISIPPPQDDLAAGPFRNQTSGVWSPPSRGGSEDPPDTVPTPSDGTTRLFLVSFLMALIFMCCLMVLLIVKSRLRQQRQGDRNRPSLRGRDAEGVAHDDDSDDDGIAARKRQTLEDRIQRRFETIEAWLVTKQVLRHDDACDRIVNNHSGKSQRYSGCEVVPSSELNDVENGGDTRGDECPICMGPMRPDEWAAWSANEACTHVFHRACIKPWLLKRVDCPCCRSELLSIDTIRGMDEKCKAIDRLLQEHERRSSLTYCCDCHGLVILRPDATWSESEADEIKFTVNRGTIVPGETRDVAPRKGGSESNVAADHDGEGRRQSLVIGRTESEEEGEIKPDGSQTNLNVELGNEDS